MTTTASSAPTAAAREIPPLGFWARIGYFLMFLGTIPLAASGIGAFLTGKAPMTHWLLMAHVGLSPAFTIGLTLVALTWPSKEARYGRTSWFFFWMMLLAGAVLVTSGVLPMAPFVGTDGQHILYLAHRYAGMAFAALLVLHVLTLFRPRR